MAQNSLTDYEINLEYSSIKNQTAQTDNIAYVTKSEYYLTHRNTHTHYTANHILNCGEKN